MHFQDEDLSIGEDPWMDDSIESFDNFDDFVEFGDSLAIGDDGYQKPDWNFEPTPPYEGGLYSTPLSWDPPKEVNDMKHENLRPIYPAATSTLSIAQQEKLRNIAMPNHLHYRDQYSPQSASSTRTHKSSSVTSPEQESSRKRKSSAEADDDEDDDDEDGKEGGPPPVKKTAHNMIEKRYRTNLNDKIAALRDSVPSLRAMSKKGKGNTAEVKEDLQGLTPAHKLNKATVLSKATEYIRHLEKRNSRLGDENTAMKARISAFERLFLSGSMGFNTVTPLNPSPYMQDQFMASPNSVDVTPGITPEGMIEVPEDIKRLHAAANQMNQQTYPVPQENYQPTNRIPIGQNGWQNGGGYFGKMMVGSLAGLMILEGFSEAEQQGEEPNTRGLFAIPIELLESLAEFLRQSADISVLGYHSSTSQTLSIVRMMLVFGTLLYIFFPSFFNSRPKQSNGKTPTASLATAPPLASPIQVRRQAWLTAVQTVWVPRHNFFLEAAALCLKMVKLSLRNAIGWYGYSLLTGITEQQEAARAKAWSIALDAQLAGGDIEINKSRLILTLMASGTLPDTPARLMLKALHVRVLLWEYGRAGFGRFFMFQEFAAKLARWKWNEARQLQQLLIHTGRNVDGVDADELPEHLAALLEHKCDDVLVDSIGLRLHNLAFNLPTDDSAVGPKDDMDAVIEDSAIRSPLDAAAAWFSTLVLQRVLSNSLSSQDIADPDVSSDLDLAIKTAPIGSGAHIRVLVARAVLFESNRSADIASAIQVIAPLVLLDGSSSKPVPTLINTSTSLKNLPDLRTSLYCAIAIAHLQRFPSPAQPKGAYLIINALQPRELSLLGFTAALKLMEALAAHKEATIECRRALENLAGSLRIWIGGKKGGNSELSRDIKEAIVERCLIVTKQCIGMEEDAAYRSMSEQGLQDGC